MEYVVIWLICGLVCAAIGHRKGEGLAAFIVGLILGPFGILFAILSKGHRKQCPTCMEMVHEDALVCPHCRRETGFE